MGDVVECDKTWASEYQTGAASRLTGEGRVSPNQIGWSTGRELVNC